jgi:hypothetical protein
MTSSLETITIATVVAMLAAAALHIVDRIMQRTAGAAKQSDKVALQERVKELESQVKFLLLQLQSANAQLVAQNGKISELQREIDLLRIAGGNNPQNVTPLKVLAIWPTNGPALPGQDEERRAMYDTAARYTALRGDDATRNGVLRTLERQAFDIIQIGAHGSEEGAIFLNDGEASPGWWSRALQRHAGQLRCMVLLACHSDEATRYNLADALLSAGVPAVIGVANSVLDADASAFARMFYEQLARGGTLDLAVDIAKLAMSDNGADMVTLRKR